MAKLNKIERTTVEGDRQAERLTKLYAQAEREIAARLQKAIARRGAGSYTAAQLKRQQAEIRGIIDELRKVSPEYIDKFVKAAYGGGVKVAEAELTAAGISILAKMGGINNKVMAVYSSQISSRLSEVLTTVGNKTADIYAILRKDDALTGVLSGYESITEAQKRMLDNAAEGDVVGFVDKAGRQWSMERYTEMLTRTATMEMHNDAKRTEFLAHGEDLVIVSDHGGSCEMCAPYNGAILSLTGATEGYETLDEAEAQGLFHPNCRHTYSLYVEEFGGAGADKTGEEAEEEKTEAENGKKYDIIANTTKGKPMTHEEADSGNVNPNYSMGGGYRDNCQSCVVVYEARLQGYDVEVLPFSNGSMLDKLSGNTKLAWLNKDGTPATYILGSLEEKKQILAGEKAYYTMSSYIKKLGEVMEVGARYNIGFAWKGRGSYGHIVEIEIKLNEKGNKYLQVYDPQSNKTITGSVLKDYFKRMAFKKTTAGWAFPTQPTLMRVDDKIFNKDVVDFIMKPKEKK